MTWLISNFSICIIFGLKWCYAMFATLHVDVGDKYELLEGMNMS